LFLSFQLPLQDVAAAVDLVLEVLECRRVLMENLINCSVMRIRCTVMANAKDLENKSVYEHKSVFENKSVYSSSFVYFV
jgi:hypothetical protein